MRGTARDTHSTTGPAPSSPFLSVRARVEAGGANRAASTAGDSSTTRAAAAGLRALLIGRRTTAESTLSVSTAFPIARSADRLPGRRAHHTSWPCALATIVRTPALRSVGVSRARGAADGNQAALAP